MGAIQETVKGMSASSQAKSRGLFICWYTLLSCNMPPSAGTAPANSAKIAPTGPAIQAMASLAKAEGNGSALEPARKPSSAAAAAAEASFAAKVSPTVQKPSSSVGCLKAVTKITPTNYDMVKAVQAALPQLLFRTLNPLLGAAGHNADELAVRLRDELMPVRSWWLKHVPWAKHQLKQTLENRRWGVPGCTNFIDARTKWFDAAVMSAMSEGIQQVVIIAAGFDTRAYRLAPPEGRVRFFEIDLPVASARKQALVKKLKLADPGVQLPVYVAADLSQVDLSTVLAGTGFDPAKPSLFSLEGLLYYLPQQAAVDLLAHISVLSAPGSKVLFDFMHAAALEGRSTSDDGYKYAGFAVTAKSVANKHEPYQFGIRDTPEAVAAFLAAASSKAHLMQAELTTNAKTTQGVQPVRAVLRLTQYLGPKDMVIMQLPHLKWSDKVPPIASFYSYAAAEKIELNPAAPTGAAAAAAIAAAAEGGSAAAPATTASQ